MKGQAMRAEFEETGFVGPVRLFQPQECSAILPGLAGPSSLEWSKGHAAASRAFYDVGRDARIVEILVYLLGPHVMLWGASLVIRRPGQSHVWHTDIETSDPSARAVSVWIGLEGANRKSSLQIAPFSHRFGASLQQVYAEAGKRRGAVSRDDILEWTTARDARSGVFEPDLSDGEALLFDGRLWHGSHNIDSETTRTALLLQYATPGTPVRIPDLEHPEWPFRLRQDVMPPCIMVAGSPRGLANRIVTAPSPASVAPPDRGRLAKHPPLNSRIECLTLPLEEDKATGWKPHRIFRGSTPSLELLACHVSVLSPGVSPHDIHAHVEEELLIMLSGEADLVMLDDDGNVSRHLARRGTFLYYPAFQPHTIHNPGGVPATYLVLRWAASRDARGAAELPRRICSADGASAAERTFSWTMLFEGPTRHLQKLHAHATVLQPGGGYDAHVDPYDVVIVTLEGEVRADGRRVGPNSVIICPGGQPHGMQNVGRRRARYLAFELHGADGRESAGPSLR